jgi:hypothetical protein
MALGCQVMMRMRVRLAASAGNDRLTPTLRRTGRPVAITRRMTCQYRAVQ